MEEFKEHSTPKRTSRRCVFFSTPQEHGEKTPEQKQTICFDTPAQPTSSPEFVLTHKETDVVEGTPQFSSPEDFIEWKEPCVNVATIPDETQKELGFVVPVERVLMF